MRKLFFTIFGLLVFIPTLYAQSLTAQQTKAVQGIVHDYLLAHPEILIAMSQKLQLKQQQIMRTKLTESVLANQSALVSDKITPTIAPANSKVALIEFFDYNCAYCSKAYPVVKAIMQANPNVTYIFKEFPIFASRFDSSNYGANIAHAIYQRYGAKKYLAYHDAVYATGKDEGALKVSDINDVLKNTLKLSKHQITKLKKLAKSEAIATQIASTMSLGEKLGLRGTPGFIIMPLTGATKANTTVIPGYTSQAALQQAIDKAMNQSRAAKS